MPRLLGLGVGVGAGVPNSLGVAPLMAAALNGFLDIVRLLSAAGRRGKPPCAMVAVLRPFVIISRRPSPRPWAVWWHHFPLKKGY